MKLSRIDQIALNGGDGLHYKYEDVAEKIMNTLPIIYSPYYFPEVTKKAVLKILVENFPNDA